MTQPNKDDIKINAIMSKNEGIFKTRGNNTYSQQTAHHSSDNACKISKPWFNNHC